MVRLVRPSTFFALAGVLALLALFVLHGSAGGVASLAAMAAFIVGAFAAVRGEHPEDRTLGTYIFGGFPN